MSKLNLPEEITLADVIPIVKALFFPQRQALKQLLDKSDSEWAQELDKWRAEFQKAFGNYPEDEVEADLKGHWKVCAMQNRIRIVRAVFDTNIFLRSLIRRGNVCNQLAFVVKTSLELKFKAESESPLKWTMIRF
jgi:hypothetical protein